MPILTQDKLKDKLETTAGVKLKLKINDNRSTMLSVRCNSDYTQVSLHRMFLGAPRNVMEALACYIRGDHPIIDPSIRSFIENNLRKCDYSHLIKADSLSTKGAVYDLQKLYDEINKVYFNDVLALKITWFGKRDHKNRVRLTFGLYHEPLKLIKIHRILDEASIPEYVVKYVIYHEMAHHVCPPYVDEKGMHRIHNHSFKNCESRFKELNLALKWIRENQERLFAKWE